MGSPITKATITIAPIAPNCAPVGTADPVAAVILAVILAASGSVPINENNGEITADNTSPMINAHTAPMAARIKANGTTGIFSTLLPSNSNLTPPNLGTSALYSIIVKKLTAIAVKNAPIGMRIIKGTANPVTTLNCPNCETTPVACTIASDMNITTAAINPKIPYIDADILVKGVSLTDFISLTSTIFLTSNFNSTQRMDFFAI